MEVKEWNGLNVIFHGLLPMLGGREELNFAIYKRCCEQEKLIV